jgi:3-oxoacyl-[acyl-carrier protein] reductase
LTDCPDFAGKVALVTGASAGIGRASAIALARCGARVAVNYFRNEAGAAETVAALGGRGWSLRADVGNPAEARGLVEQVTAREGRLDILVNNAADPVVAQPLGDWSPAQWDRVVAVNLGSVFFCSQAAAEPMKRQGGGRMIHISSIGALTGGSPLTMPYAAAKGGVETLTRGLARVLGPWNITVNAVAPGSIGTAMQRSFAAPEYIERMRKNAPLARAGTPEEVAHAVVFLASENARFITGQVLRVDGGRSA